MPRVLAAFSAGGLLAIAGALMQVLLRNPLADPYVLGVAGGAAAGALGAMLLRMDPIGVLAASWAGALISIMLVLRLGRRDLSAGTGAVAAEQPLRLLLIGVALAAGWGAMITLLLAIAPDASLRGMLFWLIGDLDGTEKYQPVLIALLAIAVIATLRGRELNVLARGAQWAQTVGVSVPTERRYLLLLASAATAVAVTTVGTVGFVGLIVPNAVRLLVGNDQRLVLPLSALVGGTLLTFADTVARSVIAPMQLPVGAMIAVLGVPAFIWLVAHRRGPG
jgi:iron complex transport system permease protein